MATQAEEQLATRAKSVQGRLETLTRVKTEVDRIRPQVEAEHEALQAQLYVQFSALQSAVERRRQELLESARRLKEYKMSLLESQSMRLEGLIEESDQGLRSSERILSSCTEMEIVQFSVMVQGRLERISLVDIPSKAATDSDFSADFNLDIMAMVDRFGHVEGLDEIPPGLFMTQAAEAKAERGAAAKAQKEEEEDEEEGGKFLMSKAKADAIARAARAAVDRAQAKAERPVAAAAPPQEVSQEASEPEAAESKAAEPEAAARIAETKEKSEEVVEKAPVAPGGTAKEELQEEEKATRQEASGSVVEYGGLVLPTDD